MPVFHRIDKDRQLIVYRAIGHCTGLDLATAEAETRKDPNRWPGMRILMDLREAKDLDFSVEDLKNGVEMNSQLESSGWELEKTAVLIASTDHEIAAGLYDDLAGTSVQLKMGLFRAVEPALVWLGLAGQCEDVERLIRGMR